MKGPFVTVLLALVVVSCFLSDGPTELGPHFSHQGHGADKGLTCTTCHIGSRSDDHAGLPGPQICHRCHDRFDNEKPPERQLAAFFDESADYRRTDGARLSDEIRFSHAAHAAASVNCTQCHGDAGTSDYVGNHPPPAKDQCMSCHADAGKSNDCASCHIQINKDWAPDSHAHAWDVAHGKVVRARDTAVSNRCSLCHEPASCQSCHRENMPVSHTNFWRLRGHGVAVSLDRSQCSTCHQTDFCIRCHENTRPQSHMAGWGFPRERHCIVCHYPLQSTNCITCHKSTPGHMQATPLPPGHLPSMNCRQCHGSGAPLPHPDNGQQCTICHR